MKMLAAAIVCLVLRPVQAQLSAAEAETISSLHERVVQAYNWDLLAPAMDEEMLDISPGSVQTWAEAAEVLDEHAPILDGIYSRLIEDERIKMNGSQARRLVQIGRADVARAIELGDRERAARRVASGLLLTRQFFSPEETVIARLIAMALLHSTLDTIDSVGMDRLAIEPLKPALRLLAESKIGWFVSGDLIERQSELQAGLDTLFAATGIDPGRSLVTNHALPEIFAGTWVGTSNLRDGDDRVTNHLRLVVERSSDDPAFITIRYTEWWRRQEGFDAEGGPIPEMLDDPEPEIDDRVALRLENALQNGWVRVAENKAQPDQKYTYLRDTHMTVFSVGRAELVTMEPIDGVDIGTLYSFQLLDDGTATFQVLGLEPDTPDSMPRPYGLTTGTLKRAD